MIEAMKQALEALSDFDYDKRMAAITALRQAIAEASHGNAEDMYVEMHKNLNCPHCGGSGHIDDVAEQEPVAWVDSDWHYQINKKGIVVAHLNKGDVLIGNSQPLYTHPPKREPLTDEQRNWIVATCPTPRHIIDVVERMHGIKGEA